MATKINLLNAAGAAINVAHDAVSSFKSEVVNISEHNEDGVLVIQVATSIDGSPKFNVYAGMNSDNMAPLLDSTGANIEFTFTTTNTIFHLANCHATYIYIHGTTNGTSSGSLTGITIIAK